MCMQRLLEAGIHATGHYDAIVTGVLIATGSRQSPATVNGRSCDVLPLFPDMSIDK